VPPSRSAIARRVADSSTEDAISAATRQVAETTRSAVIVTYTFGGSTTLRVARERPAVPILALTASEQAARRLALVWGVHIKLNEFFANVDEMRAAATAAAVESGYAAPGDRVVITAGVPFSTPGTTNLLIVETVPDDAAATDDAG